MKCRNCQHIIVHFISTAIVTSSRPVTRARGGHLKDCVRPTKLSPGQLNGLKLAEAKRIIREKVSGARADYVVITRRAELRGCAR